MPGLSCVSRRRMRAARMWGDNCQSDAVRPLWRAGKGMPVATCRIINRRLARSRKESRVYPDMRGLGRRYMQHVDCGSSVGVGGAHRGRCAVIHNGKHVARLPEFINRRIAPAAERCFPVVSGLRNRPARPDCMATGRLRVNAYRVLLMPAGGHKETT